MQVGGLQNTSYTKVSNPYETTSAKKSTNNEEEKDSQKTENSETLSAAETSLIAKLQASDMAVKRHEAAHISVGGNLIKSGANFTYTKGPDNKLYATGGEVSIDTSGGKTPEETISKMQRVRAAALAPSDPSSTDYQVASTATILEMQARLELSQISREKLLEKVTNEYANNADMDSKFSIYA